MKRILIIEPQLSGHHFRYLEWITTAACEAGLEVVIATDRVFCDNSALVNLRDLYIGRLVLHFSDFSGAKHGSGLYSLIQRELYYWRRIKIVFREVSSQSHLDHVLLPYADICLYALALNSRPFGECTWSGISMRPAFHCYEMGLSKVKPGLLVRIKEFLFFRLANAEAVSKLCVIDPCLAEYVAKHKPKSRVFYLQDPSDINVSPITRARARVLLGLERSHPIVLLYGAVDWRKGVRELLEAQASLPYDQQPTVIVAGRQAPEVRRWLAGDVWEQQVRKGSLKVFDRFVTQDEESLLFSACDTVWLGYRGHLGSSGVLWQAVAFERPVIGCSEGLIGWFITTNALGVSIEPSDKESVVSALRALPTTANTESSLNPLSGQEFAARLMQAII